MRMWCHSRSALTVRIMLTVGCIWGMLTLSTLAADLELIGSGGSIIAIEQWARIEPFARREELVRGWHTGSLAREA